jgi:hypothetical protein
MNSKLKTLGMLVFVVSFALFGCATPQLLGPTATPTASPMPTFTPTPAMPTYSEVVNTYPSGADLCHTEADLIEVMSDGSVRLSGKISYSDAQGMQYKCYGTKITMKVTGDLDGTTFQAGALLTVDKDLNWIQVSSWN